MNGWPALIYSGERITITIWLTVCIHIIYASFRIFLFHLFSSCFTSILLPKESQSGSFSMTTSCFCDKILFPELVPETNSSPDCFCPKTDCFWSVGAFSGFLPTKEPQSKMFSSCNGISNSIELFHFRIGGSDILTGISQQSPYSL